MRSVTPQSGWTWTAMVALLAAGAAVAGHLTVRSRTIGPIVCPYGAARSLTGEWVCLPSTAWQYAAERCHELGACETPIQHVTHGVDGPCLLEDETEELRSGHYGPTKEY